MRSALPLCLAIVTFASSVRADDDDYTPDPITRHWRVRVTLTEHIDSGYIVDASASYSFVTGTTDNDLSGNAYGFSQVAANGLSGLTGTGSFHSKQTLNQNTGGAPVVHLIDGNLDLNQSTTHCFYQNQENWDCRLHAAYSGAETWTGAVVPPRTVISGAGGDFGNHGVLRHDNSGHATKLPHDRFTFTNEVSIKREGAGLLQQHMTIDIEPLDSVGYEAVIVPDRGYEQWLPEGPPVAPSTHQPATLGMHVELRDAATHKPSAKSFRTHYTLESSKLVGDCMNYPAAGPPPPEKPDLYFEAGKNRSSTVSNDTLSLDLAEGKGGGAVLVSSRDWGGYAKLRAKIVVSDGAVVEALVAGSGKELLTIPKDDDGNHIADEWEKSVHGSHEPNADDESTPSGWAAPGDGYTLFEEYRGFIEADPSGTVVASKGPTKRHVRFDPNERDAFIGMAVADNVVPLGLDGIAAWAKMTVVTIHYVADMKLLATTAGDYPGGKYPRRADTWGDGHPELFGKPEMALWIQDSINLGTSPAHTDPIRAELPVPKNNLGKTTEAYTQQFGSFGDVHGVTLDVASAATTVGSMICDTDPDCKIPVQPTNQEARDDYDAMQEALGKTLGKTELRRRAAWGKANKPELDRRFTRFTFIHELGHAIGMYHHGFLTDSWNEIHGEPTCPMRYWHLHDHFIEMADFVGNKWDLTTALGGKPWKWCAENAPERRLADH